MQSLEDLGSSHLTSEFCELNQDISINDYFFDKLSESERENEKDKADIIAQKEKLNELDTTEVFKEF